MQVKVLYLGLIRNKVGKKEEEHEIREGASLVDLLNKLAETHGKGLSGFFNVDKESQLDPTFIVTVNGALRDPFHETDVKLKNGDAIVLMTLISGG
jgi:molybdopterin converting factor small subunit